MVNGKMVNGRKLPEMFSFCVSRASGGGEAELNPFTIHHSPFAA
jgi:hypothetical protein